MTAQREIEMAVRNAVDAGRLKGDEKLSAQAVITVDGLDLRYEIAGDIELE